MKSYTHSVVKTMNSQIFMINFVGGGDAPQPIRRWRRGLRPQLSHWQECSGKIHEGFYSM